MAMIYFIYGYLVANVTISEIKSFSYEWETGTIRWHSNDLILNRSGRENLNKLNITLLLYPLG